jgi:hypothetical protein
MNKAEIVYRRLGQNTHLAAKYQLQRNYIQQEIPKAEETNSHAGTHLE